eukprot:4322491-Amphidinium_carterae.1
MAFGCVWRKRLARVPLQPGGGLPRAFDPFGVGFVCPSAPLRAGSLQFSRGSGLCRSPQSRFPCKNGPSNVWLYFGSVVLLALTCGEACPRTVDRIAEKCGAESIGTTAEHNSRLGAVGSVQNNYQHDTFTFAVQHLKRKCS